MKQGKKFVTRGMAEDAFRKWFAQDFRFSMSYRYQNYLNDSHEKVFGYSYGDVLEKVDPHKYSTEMEAFYQGMDFDTFCEFMKLDVSTTIDSLMRQTDEWESFELHFVGRERGVHRLKPDGEKVYELRFFTAKEVEQNNLATREAILRQVALFDELFRKENHHVIFNNLREAREKLLKNLE